jgi:CRISPR-associated protein Cst2
LNEAKIADLLKNKQIKVVGETEELAGTTKTYELTNAEESRKTRTTGLLQALAMLTGGAKQAAFLADIAPKAMVFAGLSCGNALFNNLFRDDGKQVTLNVEALKEVVIDYANKILTPIYIGIRKDYINNEKEVRDLAKTAINGVRFVVDTPIRAVNQMCTTYLNGSGEQVEERIEFVEDERVESDTHTA